jgi:hypothetical protein
MAMLEVRPEKVAYLNKYALLRHVLQRIRRADFEAAENAV